jgi:hypothetical protein
MIRRRSAPLALVLVLVLASGCDVDSTVGFNERGGALAGGARCATDAPLARCSDGPCVVTDLFAPRIGTITIAVDRDNGYFVSGPVTLSKRPLAGGPLVELGSAETTLMRLTIDETFVYWTEQDGSVRGVPKAGGETFEAAYVFGNPTDIAADGERLYWVLPGFGQIAMAPAPSGEATQISGQIDPQAVAVDATHVYWVNRGTAEASSGQLLRAARGNLASAEVILSGLDAPINVAVTDDAVYWSSQHAAYRMRKAESGVAETLVTDLEDIKGIAAFRDTVYGAGMDGLWRVPAMGGALELVDRRAMSAITLACSGVYATGWFESAFVRYAP